MGSAWIGGTGWAGTAVLLVLGWPVWRAPARSLPEGLRLRRRHRRICWRATLVLLHLCFLALIARAYGAPGGAAVAALWLLLLAPVPGLLDAPLWRLYPARTRRAARLGAVEAALARPRRYRGLPEDQRPDPGFDPDQGWLGRPRPVFSRAPDPLPGEPLTLRPSPRMDRPERHRDWLERGAVTWDGRALFFTDGRGRHLRVPVQDAAELIQVEERREYGAVDLLMLLDRAGRYLVAMPAVGFARHELAALAAAARLPFACYQLGDSDEHGTELHPLLFPPRRAAPVLRVR